MPMDTNPLSLPLPRFRQPIEDPPLPEVTDDPAPATEPPRPGPATGPGPDSPPPSPDARPAPPPVLNPAPAARTGTSSAGDPKVAREVLAGLIALACGVVASLAARRGLRFRQPTPLQVDHVAHPLGDIVARHLPTEFISRDLVDATAAAGGVHRYLTDGPLLVRVDEPLPLLEDPA